MLEHLLLGTGRLSLNGDKLLGVQPWELAGGLKTMNQVSEENLALLTLPVPGTSQLLGRVGDLGGWTSPAK